jgi:hypothetical protein
LFNAGLALTVFGHVAMAQKKPPADDTVDFLLSTAATRPATRPTTGPSTRPGSPFEDKANVEARKGFILLSNGEKIRGNLSTTREKPIRVWDEKEKEYRDVPFALVKSIEAAIQWERDEKEWHFKESGSDIKEYTGKTYPARELLYTVTLINGQTVTGGIVCPIYASAGEQSLAYVLNKRQKGEVGKTLKELVYVKRVEMD